MLAYPFFLAASIALMTDGFARPVLRANDSERAKICASKDAAIILNTVFEDCIQHHEEFYVMLLNRSNRVLGISCISKGGISGTVVDVKIILQTALKAHATGLIISHYAE